MAVKVEIKARHMIKPAEKTWTGTLKLSEIDMVFGKVFGRTLYVYNNNNKEKWDPASINHTLKESLGKVLVHFYPLTGRLMPIGPAGCGRLELHVDNVDVTPGVPLVEAETDVELSELGDDLMEADVKGSLNNLFCSEHDPNKPLQDLPLLMVQITHFRCGGVVVALTMGHAVFDGIAACHFYTEWTRLARGESLEMTPIHDRIFLRPEEPPRSIPEFIRPPLPHTTNIQQGVDQPPSQQITLEMLRLSKSQIEKLKQSTCHVIDARPYTRFEVMIGHIWRCIAKAKEKEGKKITAIAMAMDIRKRTNPPLPRAFDGNAVIFMSVVSESKDLISNPLDYACEKIRKTINKVTNDVIWANLDYLKSIDDIGAMKCTMSSEGFFVNPDVKLINWLNLPFNNLDFGWGNELYMACNAPPQEGRVSVRADREEGSAIVSICLEVTHMDRFKYYFHQLE